MRGGGGVAPVVEQNLSLSIINTVSSSPPYFTVIFSRMKSYVATSFALNAGELSANRTSASRSGVLVSYTHLRALETVLELVCCLLLE